MRETLPTRTWRFRVVLCPFGDIVYHWEGHLRAFYFWFVARRVCVFLIFNFSDLVVNTILGVPVEDISVRLFINFCPFGDKRDSTLPGGVLSRKGHRLICFPVLSVTGECL